MSHNPHHVNRTHGAHSAQDSSRPGPSMLCHTTRTLAPAASLRRLTYYDAPRRGWAYVAGLVLEDRAAEPYRGCHSIPKVESSFGHLACAETQQSADR